MADDLIRAQMGKVFWPGRLEYFCVDQEGRQVAEEELPESGRRYLLDGAHNPAGMVSLCASLRQEFAYERLVCVWAAMADKDISTSLATISPFCDVLVFTRPESERSATPGQLRSALGPFKGEIYEDLKVENALERARTLAGRHDLILVAGSLYLVGAARHTLLGELVG